jgi:hypothetical protein
MRSAVPAMLHTEMWSLHVLRAVVSLMGKPAFRLLRTVVANSRIILMRQETNVSALFHERCSIRFYVLSEVILHMP